MKKAILILWTLLVIYNPVMAQEGIKIDGITLRQCLPMILRATDHMKLDKENLHIPTDDEDFSAYAKGKGYFQGLSEKGLDDPISSYYIARLICNILQLPPVYSSYEGLGAIGDTQRGYVAALGAKQLWDGSIGEAMTWEQWEGLLNRLAAYIEGGDKYLDREDVQSFKGFAEKLLEKEQTINPQHRFPVGTVLGQVEATVFNTQINELAIPTYLYKGRQWVNTHHLSMYGFDVNWDETVRAIYISRNVTKEISGWNQGVTDFKGEDICYNNIVVYIGTRRIPSYNINGWIMIPVEEISLFGMILQEGSNISITLSDFTYDTGFFVEVKNENWINRGLEKLDIDILHIWYNLDKKEYRQGRESIFGLEPNYPELLPLRRLLWGKNEIYIGTIIGSAGGRPNPYLEIDLEYMHSAERLKLLTEMDRKIAEEKSINMVRPSIIIGTMKRDASLFKAGEKVEILYGEDGKWYECKSVTTEKQGRIPWGSVNIPKDPITNRDRMTAEQLECYVNDKKITSPTPYFVWTDLDRQLTYVFKNQSGSWKLMRTMLSSSGRNITPTPRGFFQIQDRGAYFGKGYQAKNWVRIKGDYLYHSILFDVSGRYLLERGALGQRASQGCIRFSFEDSEWFYKTILKGTTVWIY